MGTDIYGWVEVRGDFELEPKWYGIVKASLLMSRNYNIYGCLFDVNNFANFTPAAPKRGLPSDISDAVRVEMASPYWSNCHSHSWITYAEFKAIDRDEAPIDSRVYHYDRTPDGHLTMVGQSIIPPDKLPDEVEITEEGARWEKDGLIYKADRIRKSDVLDYDVEWKRLFAIMGLLAEKFDDNNVRLVVWFGD